MTDATNPREIEVLVEENARLCKQLVKENASLREQRKRVLAVCNEKSFSAHIVPDPESPPDKVVFEHEIRAALEEPCK